MLEKEVESISIEELENILQEEDIYLLDVREQYEYNNGHISKAINIPLSAIESFSGNRSQKYYIICRSGGRSQKATQLLQKMGYNAINIDGGMNSWTGPIKKEN